MAYDSDSSMKLYLREISKTPLLTIEEENALAERIKMGDEEARDPHDQGQPPPRRENRP